VRAPPPRLPVSVPRRRPPALDRQRAWVAAVEQMVRAPPPRPPTLVSRPRPPAVARQRAWVAAVNLMVRAPLPRPSALSVRLLPRAVDPQPSDRLLMRPARRPQLPAWRLCRMLP